MRTAELQGALNAAQDKLEAHQTQTQINSEVRAKALKFVKGKLAEAEAAVLAAAPVSDSKVASIISDDLEIQQPELLTPSQVKDLLVPKLNNNQTIILSKFEYNYHHSSKTAFRS